VKKTISNTALLLLLAFSALQCHRNNDTGPAFQGRVVVYNPCGASAIEVIGNQTNSLRTLASWTDPDNDSVYHNVFTISAVRNYCTLDFPGLAKGDTVQFYLDLFPKYVICNPCAGAFPIPAVPPVSNAIIYGGKVSIVH
jgi:hypothetical protein